MERLSLSAVSPTPLNPLFKKPGAAGSSHRVLVLAGTVLIWPGGVTTPGKGGQEESEGLGSLVNLADLLHRVCSLVVGFSKIFLPWAQL